MKVLLIRHAESYGNASGGDYSVANADSLSPRGLAQAEACLWLGEIEKFKKAIPHDPRGRHPRDVRVIPKSRDFH